LLTKIIGELLSWRSMELCWALTDAWDNLRRGW